MRKSSKNPDCSNSSKPAKPYPDFPLTAHSSGAVLFQRTKPPRHAPGLQIENTVRSTCGTMLIEPLKNKTTR